MEIEYYSAEELRKIYFDVTGLDACDCDCEYYQDYCEWLETLHKTWFKETQKSLASGRN